MNKKINIKVCGKWIWAGEYAVLESHPALVFPLSSQFIELNYQNKKNNALQIISSFNSKNKKINLQDLFQNVLDQALCSVSKSQSDLKGTIEINSQMIFGAGLGASAVICVLIGRLFYFLKWIKKEELFYFCHSLENNLHGQSSGVDIAAVLMGKPIVFKRSKGEVDKISKFFRTKKPALEKTNWLNEMPKKAEKPIIEENDFSFAVKKTPQIKIFQPKWQPYIFLSHSGEARSTKENIKKVKLFWEKEPEKANILNQQMTQAVLTAKEGLKAENKKEGLALLIKSFSLAEDCFFKWDLIEENIKQLMLFLKKQGALAVKPTGSGAGGCVLSLWSKKPPGQLNPYLISAF